MTAEIHLDLGCEPTQAEAVILAHEECRLRQVHLLRHSLHPLIVPGLWEEADSRRVSGEGTIRESVNLK